jgi:hypothetical protein
MKVIILLALFQFAACDQFRRERTPTPDAPPVPDFKSAYVEGSVPEEDCDQKAKKTVEIKEDTISLTGDAGCTLEE